MAGVGRGISSNGGCWVGVDHLPSVGSVVVASPKSKLSFVVPFWYWASRIDTRDGCVYWYK
jgi:hypothetical protein